MRGAGYWLIGLGLAGCGRTVAPPDATIPDASVAAPDAPDTSRGADAPARVMTCSELAVRTVTASPGRGMLAYPGSRLVLRGDDLAVVESVSVGAIDRPFTRDGDALVTDVPPMLDSGPQAVTVVAGRCMTSAVIQVSRLLARVPRGATPGPSGADGRVTLLDATDLSTVGALDLGPAGPGGYVQAAFTLDGATLVVRGADGTVALAQVASGRRTALGPRATGPFVLAQGTVVPTEGLLVVPSPTPEAMLHLDSPAGTATPYPGPASDPVGVATTLDGFRALVLDRSGVVYALDRPFGATPAWERLGAVAGIRTPGAISMAQGDAADGPLAVLWDASTPPALVPLNGFTGAVGPRVELPGAVDPPYFVSGDIVAMDSVTPEVLLVDVTGLAGRVIRIPLAGEAVSGAPGTPVARTATAVTLFQLGAVVLRVRPGAVPEGDVLHLLDLHHEPVVGETAVRLPGARGLVGIHGRDDPFFVWTARSIVRVPAATPADQRRADLAPGDGDIGLLAIQP